MWAFFHWGGTLPWSIEAWNRRVIAGDISTAVSFRSLVGIPSGPEAVKGFWKFLSSFMTRFWQTVMLSIVGWWSSGKSGRGDPSSTEKTEVNCLLRMFAWSSGSSVRIHGLSVDTHRCCHTSWIWSKHQISCSFCCQDHCGWCHKWICCKLYDRSSVSPSSGA